MRHPDRLLAARDDAPAPIENQRAAGVGALVDRQDEGLILPGLKAGDSYGV